MSQVGPPCFLLFYSYFVVIQAVDLWRARLCRSRGRSWLAGDFLAKEDEGGVESEWTDSTR